MSHRECEKHGAPRSDVGDHVSPQRKLLWASSNESNICSSSRDLTRCPSTSTVCVCRSSQVKLHWPPDLASPPLHQRAHHGAHAQNRPCRWAEQGSHSHKKGQEGQAFPQQRSKYAAHPQAVATTATIFGVRPDFRIFQQSQWLRSDIYTLYESSAAAAETRQANKAHP